MPTNNNAHYLHLFDQGICSTPILILMMSESCHYPSFPSGSYQQNDATFRMKRHPIHVQWANTIMSSLLLLAILFLQFRNGNRRNVMVSHTSTLHGEHTEPCIIRCFWSWRQPSHKNLLSLYWSCPYNHQWGLEWTKDIWQYLNKTPLDWHITFMCLFLWRF